jgi:hypothetical protein
MKDFVLLAVVTTGGIDIVSKESLKEWASAFIEKNNDLRFEVLETFQKEPRGKTSEIKFYVRLLVSLQHARRR